MKLVQENNRVVQRQIVADFTNEDGDGTVGLSFNMQSMVVTLPVGEDSRRQVTITVEDMILLASEFYEEQMAKGVDFNEENIPYN